MRLNVKKLFESEIFYLGFWLGTILFFFLNASSYESSFENQANSEISFSAGGSIIGFPFTMYKAEIGYLNHYCFVWSGLIADILIAILA